jgi:hypothetical protein
MAWILFNWVEIQPQLEEHLPTPTFGKQHGRLEHGFTASDFLDDTTSANPTVISSGENLIFKLTVIDSKSNICTDSVNVRFSIFGTHLGTCNYVIQHGDSVFLSNFHNVLGGISPVNYLWRQTMV